MCAYVTESICAYVADVGARGFVCVRYVKKRTCDCKSLIFLRPCNRLRTVASKSRSSLCDSSLPSLAFSRSPYARVPNAHEHACTHAQSYLWCMDTHRHPHSDTKTGFAWLYGHAHVHPYNDTTTCAREHTCMCARTYRPTRNHVHCNCQCRFECVLHFEMCTGNFGADCPRLIHSIF